MEIIVTKPAKGAKTAAASTKPAMVRERAVAVAHEPLAVPSQESARGRRPVNLTLDRDAVERGERFANRHGISVSTLVSGFLQALPDEVSDAAPLAPPVQRLYGLATGPDLSRDMHRAFLANKYGVK